MSGIFEIIDVYFQWFLFSLFVAAIAKIYGIFKGE